MRNPEEARPRAAETAPAAAGASIGTGFVVGALGGVVLWAYLSLVWYIRDLGFWWPTKVIATLWYGEDALVTGRPGDILTVGIVTVVVAYAVWGAIYGLFGGLVRFGIAAVGALVFALLVWLVDYFVVGGMLEDAIYDQMFIRDEIEWYHALIAHLLYGLVLSLTPLVRPR